MDFTYGRFIRVMKTVRVHKLRILSALRDIVSHLSRYSTCIIILDVGPFYRNHTTKTTGFHSIVFAIAAATECVIFFIYIFLTAVLSDDTIV